MGSDSEEEAPCVLRVLCALRAFGSGPGLGARVRVGERWGWDQKLPATLTLAGPTPMDRPAARSFFGSSGCLKKVR
mgnify:CR=1 FL=1